MRRWNWRGLFRRFDSYAAREWRWLVVIAWLAISAGYFLKYTSAIRYFSLGDTDDNMRYLQVHDWLAGQGWWDLTQHRMDPPDGANIHWSRLVDLPIAGLMLLFRLFMSPFEADKIAVAVAPLIPLLPLMLALAFLARRLARPYPLGVGWHGRNEGGVEGAGQGWIIAILLILGARMGLGMYMPLRIDHHGWQLALTAMTLAGLVDRKWVRGGIVAGVSSAASVAIGMEMMVFLAAAGALIALRWIFKEGAVRRMRPYALSLGGATAVGYALFASNANRLPVCDALSPVWTSILVLAAGVLFLLSLLPLRDWPQRLAAAAIGGAVIGGFAWFAWPECLTGAYQISPELESSWLVYIREAKPITAQVRSSWMPMMAIPAAGMLCALAGCWAARRDSERLWAWGTVALMIAFAVALMFWQIRLGPAAQLLSIPPIAWAMWALVVALFTARWPLRIAAAFGLAGLTGAANAYGLYPLVNGAIVNLSKPTAPKLPAVNNRGNTGTANAASAAPATNADANAGNNNAANPKTPPNRSARCRTLPALRALNEVAPATIFTMVDLGPRLIATTHHSVIAGPYHRNGEAILDIHHAFDGSPERFRAIAAAHGATYLLICPGFPEGTIYQRRSPKGFYARVARGERFDFLEPVELKSEGTLPYQLYRIAPQKTGKAAG